MSRFAILFAAAFAAGCSTTSGASSPPVLSGSTAITARAAAPDVERPDPKEVRALQTTLRDLVLHNLPTPAVQSKKDWGKQKETTRGRLRGNPVKRLENDGHWRRFSVTVLNPEKTLALGITEAAFPEPGKATLTAMIGVDCGLKFEQQLWQNGRRLYSGETRGTCHAALLLKCEVISRSETKPGQLIPDLVFRMRVTEAQLFYEDLKIDHTAGIGGDGARILGEAIIDAVKRFKPDFERELLDKANAAIVKAADTKEVRISVQSLFQGESMVGRN